MKKKKYIRYGEPEKAGKQSLKVRENAAAQVRHRGRNTAKQRLALHNTRDATVDKGAAPARLHHKTPGFFLWEKSGGCLSGCGNKMSRSVNAAAKARAACRYPAVRTYPHCCGLPAAILPGRFPRGIRRPEKNQLSGAGAHGRQQGRSVPEHCPKAAPGRFPDP